MTARLLIETILHAQRVARLVAGATCVCALAGQEVGAQEVTGSIQGRVVAQSGAPVTNARIRISGRQLLGVREYAVDARGYFTAPALPPGEYEVRILRLGARPTVLERVPVALGRTTVVDVPRIAVEALQLDEVRVTAPRYSLDPTRTDAGATLDAREYDALPSDRDYKSIIAILPHVNQSHRGDPVNSAGATGLENMYFIDGVNVTSPRRGETGTILPQNFVRAIEVKTGGYEAQFGRALGALVNAVTYSGSNTFESEVFGYVTTSSLSATPKAPPLLRETGGFSYDVGARVGGPIVRHRLWYSAAYNPRATTVQREIAGLGRFDDRKTSHVLAGKVSWKAAPRTDVELSVFGDPTVHHSIDPGGLTGVTPLTPDPYRGRNTSGGRTGSLRLTSLVGVRSVVEASLSRFDGTADELAETTVGRDEIRFADRVAGTVAGGRGFLTRSTMSRTTAAIRGRTTLGRHSVVAGVEYDDASVFAELSNSGGFLLARIPNGSFRTFVGTQSGTSHNRGPTAYVQDSWQLRDGLTVSPGLRLSSQALSGASGEVAQRLSGEWQPRLGVVWLPGPSGKQRVFASLGRFYQQIPLFLASAWYSDWVSVETFYPSDPRAGGVTPIAVTDRSTTEAQWARHIPGVRAEHSDELTIGYERLIGSAGTLTVRGIRRELRSSFQWGGNPGSADYWVLGTPGERDFAFLPRPRREYTALEIASSGLWSGVAYRMSYVLSRNWGNYTGLYDSDKQFATPGATGTFFGPEHATNSTGLLPNDRTHSVKLSGSRAAPFGLTTGAFVTWESGSPLNIWGTSFAHINGLPVFLVPRGSDGRTPSLWDVNLRVSYQPGSAERARYRLVLDALHIFNPQRPTVLEETQFFDPDQTALNPTFRVPLAFQPPALIRLGAELRF
jgi:hypothetical protein